MKEQVYEQTNRTNPITQATTTTATTQGDGREGGSGYHSVTRGHTMTNTKITTMMTILNEWLRSLEDNGHSGDHDDCPNCQRYWAILKAWSAMDDLAELVRVQGDDDEVTR